MVNLLAGLLCGGTAVGCFLFATPTAAPAAALQGKEADRQFTGTIEELWTTAPGRVQVRIRGTDDKGKQQSMWFETPADQDVNTLFENLVMSLLRHALTNNVTVTIQADNSSGDDGTVAAKAFDIVRVGFRAGS